MQHVLVNQSACSLAEYELLAETSRPLLIAISRAIERTIDYKSFDQVLLIDCFHVVTLLISLFGTKLSRNQKVLSSLVSLAWNIMSTFPERKIQQSACSFLASVPLAGIDKQTPDILWTNGILSGIAAWFLLLEALAPINTKSFKCLDTKFAKGHLAGEMNHHISAWIDELKKRDSGGRLLLFNLLSAGLGQYLVSLLKSEAVSGPETNILTTAQFPMTETLDLLELIISFPSTAERVFNRTKKQLRFEIVEGGLLSPFDITNGVTNHMKKLGLDLFSALLQSLGRPTLLPFGKRIMKLAYTSLLTSCTLTLRHALDPAEPFPSNRRRKMGLHAPTVNRTKAIEILKMAFCILGSNAVALSSLSVGTTLKAKTTDADEGVVLVMGCLLEVISFTSIDRKNLGDVGTTAVLVVSAISSISEMLLESSGFLPFHTRTLIDSTAKVCCEIYGKGNVHVLFLMSEVKIAVLDLLTACLTSPWPDGATANLLEEALLVANRFKLNVDWNVSMKARFCLQLFSTLETPRSPPFLQIHRKLARSESTSANQPVDDALALMSRLETLENKLQKEDLSEGSRGGKRKREKDDNSADTFKTKHPKTDVNTSRVEEKPGERKDEENTVAASGTEVSAQDTTTEKKQPPITSTLTENVEIAGDKTEITKSLNNKKELSSSIGITQSALSQEDESKDMRNGLSNVIERKLAQEEDDEDFEDQIPGIVDCGPDGFN